MGILQSSTFKQLKSGELEELVLQRCGHNDIPPKLFKVCKLLKSLDLKYNNFQSLSKEVYKLESLTKLDISCNLLKKFPPSLCTIVTLKHLDLSYNHIPSLPDEFSELKSLEQLYLAFNDLKGIETTC